MTDEIQSITIGSPAYDFQLPSSSGGKFTLSGFQDKATVVLFFVREYN
jgi:peroxiredoxin